jgi:hypothetical protein
LRCRRCRGGRSRWPWESDPSVDASQSSARQSFQATKKKPFPSGRSSSSSRSSPSQMRRLGLIDRLSDGPSNYFPLYSSGHLRRRISGLLRRRVWSHTDRRRCDVRVGWGRWEAYDLCRLRRMEYRSMLTQASKHRGKSTGLGQAAAKVGPAPRRLILRLDGVPPCDATTTHPTVQHSNMAIRRSIVSVVESASERVPPQHATTRADNRCRPGSDPVRLGSSR